MYGHTHTHCGQCGKKFWAREADHLRPRYCTVACYRQRQAMEARWRRESKAQQAAETAAVRVPATFFNDHEERECEPFCTPIKQTSRFVWLRLDDPGLGELLDDARHYADPDAIDDEARLRKSAAATVAAIVAAQGGSK